MFNLNNKILSVETQFGTIFITTNKLNDSEIQDFKNKFLNATSKDEFLAIYRDLHKILHQEPNKDIFEEIFNPSHFESLGRGLEELFANIGNSFNDVRKESGHTSIFKNLIDDDFIDKQIEFLQQIKQKREQKSAEENEKMNTILERKQELEKNIQIQKSLMANLSTELSSAIGDSELTTRILERISTINNTIKSLEAELHIL